MPAMRVVGSGHELSEHAHVRRDSDAYVIELDVSDFDGPQSAVWRQSANRLPTEEAVLVTLTHGLDR
jgi:ornithine carbamoyltransferase